MSNVKVLQNWFLLRLLSLAFRCPSSPCVFSSFSLCVCILISFCKDIGQYWITVHPNDLVLAHLTL